jgi:hypothetical protein
MQLSQVQEKEKGCLAKPYAASRRPDRGPRVRLLILISLCRGKAFKSPRALAKCPRLGAKRS